MSFSISMTEQIVREKVPAEQHVIDLQSAFKKNGLDDFIYLAYGETWQLAPKQLQALLSESDIMDNGYQLSSWGRPAYREIVRSYMLKQHRLPENCSWMVGWSCNGTRVKMYDFARLIKNQAERQPIAICALPSWDYQRVFEANAFICSNFSLQQKNGFLPNMEEFHECLRKSCTPGRSNHHVVVILNTQHNPTGVNWPHALTKQFLKLALEYQTSLLIDDAYFAVDSPSDPATSALALLHELTAGQKLEQPWLAVRSFGKQFNCNGWGLGAVVCQRDVLEKLGELSYHHTYGYGGVWQSAMCKWLGMPESTDYVREFCAGLQEKKAFVKSFLSENSDYPQEMFYSSTCSPYYLLQVPSSFTPQEQPNRAFILHALDTHKLMMAPANMALGAASHGEWIRLYLGSPLETIKQACRRLATYRWQ